jgi:hypothetical protein
MNTVWASVEAWDHAFNELTKLCLAVTAACFSVGGLLVLADGLVSSGPRGIGLIVVGCFYLIHGLVEVGNQWWKTDLGGSGGNLGVNRPTHLARDTRGESGERTAA